MSRTRRKDWSGRTIRDGQHGSRCPEPDCDTCATAKIRRQKPLREDIADAQQRRIEPDNLLSPAVTVRCFWWPRCHHQVTDTPVAAHDAMEVHYRQRHQEDIQRIIGWAS